ncbi:MAG: NAD-dependent malic enzyme, partial [Proteobacteria bacterium]|nr:NAD-dependent malic enzyme [Pseudomonadota bacterium]
LSHADALQRLWFIDQNGLVVKSRKRLAEHIVPYAQDHPAMSFVDAIKSIKPHVLIGATGVQGTFTEEVIRLMAELNERPAIFALSNPSSHAECTAQQAYEWTEGRAIFASGSPSDAVNYHDKTFRPGQGNNAYIFPGVGLGVIACNASRITDEMFLAAADTLADMVKPEHLEQGTIYPPLKDIRAISLKIACAVAECAYAQNLAQNPRPDDLSKSIKKIMYDPGY